MGHKHFLFNFFFSIKKSLGLTQNFLSYVIKIKGDVHAPSACAQHKKPVLHEPSHVLQETAGFVSKCIHC